MTSNRPYLLRALFDWICDNGATPYLLVDASIPGVQVPTEHVEDGKIVLNIAPSAVRSLMIGDDLLSFDARFSGREMALEMPIGAVRAIFARETQEGMTFPPEPETAAGGMTTSAQSAPKGDDEAGGAPAPGSLKVGEVSHLKIIK